MAVSAFYLWRAVVLPDAPNAVVSPRAYPIAIGIFTVGVSLYLLVDGVRTTVRTKRAGSAKARAVLGSGMPAGPPLSDTASSAVPAPADELASRTARAEQLSTARYVAVMSGVIVVGLVAFERLGAAVSSFIFVAGLSTVAEPRRWLRNVLAAATFALVSDYAFRYGLDVYLPTGPW